MVVMQSSQSMLPPLSSAMGTKTFQSHKNIDKISLLKVKNLSVYHSHISGSVRTSEILTFRVTIEFRFVLETNCLKHGDNFH